MPQSKSDEIRLVFLEEAEKHLNTIQSAIYKLAAESRLQQHECDDIIRAAHSIKGGARMTGFQCLGELADRLEDFFKFFKDLNQVRNPDLEYLLLLALEQTWQVFALNREVKESERQWVETQIHPLFERLHILIKDLTPAELSDSALPSEPQSVVALIFETEIEQCLNILESILKQADKSCLLEEVLAILDSLTELGEMLQVVTWNRQCESIIQELKAFPERVEEIASVAFQKLRFLQAEVLSGQVDDLTAQLDSSRLPAASEPQKIAAIPTNYKILNPPAVPVQLSILPSARFKVEDFSELQPDLAFFFNQVEESNQSKQLGMSSNKLKQLLDLFNEVNNQHEHTSELLEQLLRQHKQSSQLLLVLRDEISQLADIADPNEFDASSESATPHHKPDNGFNGNSTYHHSLQGQARSHNGNHNGSAKSNGFVVDDLNSISDFALDNHTPDHELQTSNSNKKFSGAAEPTQPKPTILVVDDSLTIRSVVSSILSAAGYQPELAVDGKEAVDKLDLGLGVSAVICDLDMPNLNGYGFLTHVKSDPKFSDIPVVMLTSNNDEKSRARAELLGAADYLIKPCKDEDLLRSLKELIMN